MMILRLKNPTNIYRIDAKKTRRGARIPCSRRSTDQIKVSKVQYADSWGRANWGEKKPKREETEEEEGSGRKVGAGVKTQARRHSPWRRAQRQDLRRRAPCHVTSTWVLSPRARRQGRRRRDVLARRQHRWRRAKGSDFEIIPLTAYLWKYFKKRAKKQKIQGSWSSG